MWIMLITKLLTRPSPPKMSIFWSVPANNPYKRKGMPTQDEYEEELWKWGREPDWDNARWIRFAGESIRVFPHEFSIIPPERMNMYVGESHFLVAEDAATEILQNQIVINHNNRDIFDSALLDGCNKEQAFAVVAGVDITLPDPEYPPIGWYRIRKEYGELFCDEYELLEHREAVSEVVTI